MHLDYTLESCQYYDCVMDDLLVHVIWCHHHDMKTLTTSGNCFIIRDLQGIKVCASSQTAEWHHLGLLLTVCLDSFRLTIFH